MKLIHLASILVLFSTMGEALAEDNPSGNGKGKEIPEVVGTWKSKRTVLSIYPDRRFEMNGGPKIEKGIWEESSDVGFYLRYRARNPGEAGLSRAGHFVFEQGEIVFQHDDEEERFKRVGTTEETEEKKIPKSNSPVGVVGKVKVMNDFSKRVAVCLKDFKKLKPGMSRGEINRLFPRDGGIHRVSQVRFTHPECPYLKVDVEFEFKSDPDDQNRPIRGDEDRATSISKPYVEAPHLD